MQIGYTAVEGKRKIGGRVYLIIRISEKAGSLETNKCKNSQKLSTIRSVVMLYNTVSTIHLDIGTQ